MSATKHSSLVGALGGTAFAIVVLAAIVWGILHRQYIVDEINAHTYTPSSAVKTVEQQIDLTGKGQLYFNATHPEVDESNDFNKDCPRKEVGNPILGCYANNRIYIFDVTNQQLSGIEEVTAAHELLHAAWERMDNNEKTKIGDLLQTEYKKQPASSDLVERMQYYQRTEPGEFVNELHSILGTETAQLSPELEAHYKEYFNNRQSIVSLHDKYNSVFQNLKDQSDALYKQLTDLSANIDARTTQYNADASQLSTDIQAFNAKAQNGGFSSMKQFNTERAALVARSNQIDAERASISADINTYNAKYDDYKKISSQVEALNKSIDSYNQLQPSPTIK